MPHSKHAATSEMNPERSGEDANFSNSSAPLRNQFKQLTFDVLARWRWLVLGIILGILAGIFCFSKVPKIYRATATLLVTLPRGDVGGVQNFHSREDLVLRTEVGMNTLAFGAKRLEFLVKVAKALQTNETAMEANLIPCEVDGFLGWSGEGIGENKEVDPRCLDPVQLACYITSWTRVGIAESNKQLLEITVAHRDPEMASLVANNIAIEFENELTKEWRAETIRLSNLLTQEAEKIRNEIQELEKSLANYQTTFEALAELDQLEDNFTEIRRSHKDTTHPKHKKAEKALKAGRAYFFNELKRVRNEDFDRKYWRDRNEELDESEKVSLCRHLLRARATTLNHLIQSKKQVISVLLTKALADRRTSTIGVESSMSQVPGSPASPTQGPFIFKGASIGFVCFLLFVLLLVKFERPPPAPADSFPHNSPETEPF